MNLPHPHCPQIAPVPAGVTRPLWSVMIPTYNCAEYLRETLASVLAQDPGPDIMQIAVIDNCSTQDDPAAVVAELGQGRVEFYRQPTNVGAINNSHSCLELARGHLIHLLHSDDCVRDGFYQKMAQAFQENPQIGAAFCRSVYIDEHSNWQGLSYLELPESGILPSRWIERIAELCCISVPSVAVVRREVYEQLGGYDRRCGLSGDWEMWVRVFTNYPMWFEAEPLALWRRHFLSVTQLNAKSKTFIQETFDTVEIIFQSYLPSAINGKIHKIAKQNCAFLSLEAALALFAQDKIPQAIAQLQIALQYRASFKVIKSAIRIMVWEGMRSLLRKISRTPKYQTTATSAAINYLKSS
ncbi:family 2 glycosyl transferase [Nostoc sp. CENA543]|uniref:glycosyltransferase n=1 Tax=Nostoc sp. CENA543 TaxID=1869241 RepID=UPI000CA0B79D|nr:glycosyltransferase [Nostoc sp. CENA543]AUT01577.1 family 2 glycosyl transferase [Nostoc sp. CENA543]